jgi:peptidoglycan/xylan/chitin deacetylase (PgdA/CDA1 family)
LATRTFAPVLRRATLLAALTLAALIFSAPVQARAATVVSLTFDDGSISQLYAKDRLAERGLRGTFFINTGNIQPPQRPNPYFMTWGEVASVAATGNEIGGHTVNDLNLVTGFPNDSARRDAICNDRANLIAHGFTPVSFAYPHGAYNAQIISLVQQCGYASARTAGGLNEPGFPYTENIPPVNPYAVRTNQPHDGPFTLAELQGYFIRAGGSGWVPFMFHDVCDLPCAGKDPNGSVSPQDFTNFLTFLQNSGAVVKTVRDVILPPPPPPPPPPPVLKADKVTAFASLKAPKSQDIDKLFVRAAMVEPGTLSASATVSVPGAARVFKFKRASRKATAGKSVKLRLKISKKGLRSAKRAMRRGKRLRAKIRVTAKDRAGNSRTAKRTVRLRP